MKTLPNPSAGDREAERLRALRAFDDDLFRLSDPAREERAAPPVGVVPRGSRVPPISLGSRRPCDKPGDPSSKDASDQIYRNEYERPVIACIEWRRVTFYREARPRPPVDLGKLEPESVDQITEATDHEAADQGQPVRDGNLTRGIFNGYMSPATRRKVRKIVSTWIRSVMLYRAEVKRRWDPGRAYPVFVTLTLPSDQVHSDQVINRACLQPFIVYLRRHHGIEHYFWRAESQENGRIHFHLLTDRYIAKEDLQIAWNKCVNVLGYVDRYYEKTGEASPPSTEVHRIRDKVKDRKTGEWRSVDPVDYLLDYVMDAAQLEALPAPGDQQRDEPRRLVGRYRAPDGSIHTYYTRAISGRVWGMSDSLREIREPRAMASYRLINALENATDSGELRRVDQDHATLYFGKVSVILGRAHPGMWDLIKRYYLNVFGYLYPAQLPPEYVKRWPLEDPRDLWIDLENFASYHREPPELIEPLPSWNYKESGPWIKLLVGGVSRIYYAPEFLRQWPAIMQEHPDRVPPGLCHWIE